MSDPDPIPPVFGPDSPRDPRASGLTSWTVSLMLILEVALAVRILAADALEWYLRRAGTGRICLFPDTNIYWQLARCIRSGDLYEIIEWADIPYFAVRTPGYPLFLAACHALFDENTLLVRLVQAFAGTLCVYLVYLLTDQVAPRVDDTLGHRPWTAAMIAAAIVAIHPYFAVMSSLILSEAVFEPFMLAALLAIGLLWIPDSNPTQLRAKPVRRLMVALGGGAAAGAALLVRPSWALFLPVMLGAWLVDCRRDRDRLVQTVGYCSIFIVGLSVVMSPWWARNYGIYGRFVPTALWMGASLYDGLNPHATGASDMTFRQEADLWPLDEIDQDRELTRRSIAFARENPGRAVELGVRKIGRYWSPWPNADVVRGIGPAVIGAAIELPFFALMVWGFWLGRRDLRALTLLAGPILYFCALHAVFASSMRYRLPGEIPAAGLAAIGLLAVYRERFAGRRVLD